ncbi:MAG: PqqD family peptide modification chaperone [Bacteroides sp.]|nr:PqqD family peptide modification chaperone [Bacteroides sp.]
MPGKINLLEVIPYRNERISVAREGECIRLGIPRFKRQWMQRFLLPKGMSPFVHVTLEEHGTEVWELIDGKRTVGEIIALLGDYFQHQEGYDARVTAYITQLRKDNLIGYRL